MSSMTIVCDFNLGLKKQTIYKCDPDNGILVEPVAEVEFETLPDMLAYVCNKYGAEDVELYGPDAIVQVIGNRTLDVAVRHYGLMNLNVKIN